MGFFASAVSSWLRWVIGSQLFKRPGWKLIGRTIDDVVAVRSCVLQRQDFGELVHHKPGK
jgi:hypothetical protein